MPPRPKPTDRRLNSVAADQPPLTVSRSELLVDGGDARFRQLIHDLLTVSVRMEAVRGRLGRRLGLTGPQYSILMAVAHMQGAGRSASIRAVAELLHVSGPFITAEGGKLVEMGLLDKSPNPRDKRSVLLTLTTRGRAAIEDVAPSVRAINDRFFGALKAEEFARLADIAALLVEESDAALAVADAELSRRADHTGRNFRRIRGVSE